MSRDAEIDVQKKLEDRPRVQNALRKAVQHAIRFHKIMGVPIVVWEDGKVVEIPPEEIVVDQDVLDEPPRIPRW